MNLFKKLTAMKRLTIILLKVTAMKRSTLSKNCTNEPMKRLMLLKN
jgi:hypothetical protein